MGVMMMMTMTVLTMLMLIQLCTWWQPACFLPHLQALCGLLGRPM